MYLSNKTNNSTEKSSTKLDALRRAMKAADAVLIGAGAGLSASAGFTYSGERFEQNFTDFKEAYGISDMYSGGFYPFETPEERWAWWSRQIMLNRYDLSPAKAYVDLLKLMQGKDYFVLTTNVDHQFQLAGFDKQRLFYTQGDYGLWQCAKACHQKTYDNEAQVREMALRQQNMRIPTELVPHCPVCGAPMAMNLRADDLFVQDDGWYQANARYQAFLQEHKGLDILYLELGVGFNTPGIIKIPFWQMTAENPNAVYASVNQGEAFCPPEIEIQSICINHDVANVLAAL